MPGSPYLPGMTSIPERLFYVIAAAVWWYCINEFTQPLRGGGSLSSRDTDRYLMVMLPASVALVAAACTSPDTKWGQGLRWFAIAAIGLAFSGAGLMGILFLAYLLGALFGNDFSPAWYFIWAVATLGIAWIVLFNKVGKGKPVPPQHIADRLPDPGGNIPP